MSILTNVTPLFLANYHYRHAGFNDAISSLAFDEYFRILDPGKTIFTAEDIEEFEPYRYRLDDLALEGNSEFAFKVYDLFVRRLKLYKEFAEDTLKKPFDFTVEEEIRLDRSDEPYFGTLGELKEFWRKKLKSDVLNNRLLKRIGEYELDAPDAVAGMPADELEKRREQQKLAALWNRSPEEQVLRRLRDVNNVLVQNQPIEILALYLGAIARSYGPHTDYLAPAADENFDISMKLSLFGIGATLTTDDGYVKVVEIVPGSPASKEGSLKAGDRIIAVAQDGQEPVDVIDMSLEHVVKLVRGPEGSKVTLTVLPGQQGRGAIPQLVSIVRGKVELKDSEARGKVYEFSSNGEKRKLGVIRLDSFYMDFDAYLSGDKNYKSCTVDVRNILDDFNAAGVEGLVVDMRNNGGGSLPEAISLSGLFIEEGPIVQVRYSGGKAEVQYDKDSSISFSGPMVVLTNRFTSSAAEIFSGAMKDYKRALLAGDSRTYGKGTVLQVAKLERLLDTVHMSFPAGSLRYECAMYFRVNGDSTQARGVEPDLVFPSFSEYMEVGEEYSPNYLPWEEIAPVDYEIFYPDFQKTRETLLRKSATRLAADENYSKFQERVERARQMLERGEVSLNEEKRFGEYLANRDFQNALDSENMIARDNDLLMNEALNILGDWLELEKNQ